MINKLVFPMDKHIVGTEGFRNLEVNGRVLGFQVTVRLSYYRALPLSCVEEVHLFVDGVEVPRQDITLCLNDKRFTLDLLRDLYSEWWSIIADGVLEVARPGGLSAGAHEVEIRLVCRSPYMFFHGDYARRQSQDKKTLNLAA
jgi:hypothetical protein